MNVPKMTDVVPFHEHAWSGYSTDRLRRKISQLHYLALSLGLEVIVGHYADEAFASGRYGDYLDWERLIRINARNHGFQTVGTLGHEIGHAIFGHLGPNNDADEEAANRVMLALVLDEVDFAKHFDPDRHLYRSPNQNREEVVDLFACDFRTLRTRVQLGPSSLSSTVTPVSPTTTLQNQSETDVGALR